MVKASMAMITRGHSTTLTLVHLASTIATCLATRTSRVFLALRNKRTEPQVLRRAPPSHLSSFPNLHSPAVRASLVVKVPSNTPLRFPTTTPSPRISTMARHTTQAIPFLSHLSSTQLSSKVRRDLNLLPHLLVSRVPLPFSPRARMAKDYMDSNILRMLTMTLGTNTIANIAMVRA